MTYTPSTANPLEDFLSHLNDAAKMAAERGSTERLTDWVRQAMREFPVIRAFLAQTPGALLTWLHIAAPGLYNTYITCGCGEDAALRIVGEVQERLNT